MVFALAKGNGGLLAFPAAGDAAAHCSAMEVRAGAWLFFSDDGSPLEARFDPPDPRRAPAESVSAYILQRAMAGLWLQERLAQVKRVEGCGLASVAELVELLKVNRSKRIPPSVRRR
jgi:hypothetical protein